MKVRKPRKLQPKPTVCSCGQDFLTHQKCDACTVLLGAGHWDYGIDHRGHMLCPSCLRFWQAYPEKDWRTILHPAALPDIIRG